MCLINVSNNLPHRVYAFNDVRKLINHYLHHTYQSLYLHHTDQSLSPSYLSIIISIIQINHYLHHTYQSLSPSYSSIIISIILINHYLQHIYQSLSPPYLSIIISIILIKHYLHHLELFSRILDIYNVRWAFFPISCDMTGIKSLAL